MKQCCSVFSWIFNCGKSLERDVNKNHVEIMETAEDTDIMTPKEKVETLKTSRITDETKRYMAKSLKER